MIVNVATALWLAGCGSAGRPVRTSTSSASQPVRNAAAQSKPATLVRDRPRGVVITARTSQYGRILTDGAHRTIYLFTRDRSTASTCYGGCATKWPPVLTHGAPRARGGVTRLGVTRRRDGATQVTIGGHPLYYYVGDVRPGDILCQDAEEFGGTWLVVSRGGSPLR